MKELVEILEKVGVVDAEKKVRQMKETIDKLRPNDTEENKYAILKMKVLQFANVVKKSGAKVLSGVVLGYDEYRDVYAGFKEAAIAEYRSDPAGAIARGVVRVEGDKIIPLDNRETLPSGEPNPRYGKPIPEVWRRNVYVVIDGKLKRVIGDIRDEPEIGGVYTFAGIERDDGTIVLSKIRPWMKVGEAKDVWEIAENALKEYAVEFDEIVEWHRRHAEDYSRMCAVKGVVMFETETSSGGRMMVVDDIDEPTGEGIVVFAPISYAVGTEVIAFGRTFESTDPMTGENRIILNAFGVIANPESEVDQSIVEELDEILWS